MSELLHSLQNIPPPFNMIVLLALIGGVVAVLCTAIVQVQLFDVCIELFGQSLSGLAVSSGLS
jgi:RsiW-degrading membrane proteinase PrsW (M82 family)